MAMSSVIRMASSTVVSHPIRAIASSRILSGSITNTLNGAENVPTPLISQNFCTEAKKLVDRKLIKVLNSEIRLTKLLEFQKTKPPTPPDFPFTIEDSLRVKDLHLKREFPGEEISISVNPPNKPNEDNKQAISDANGGSGGPSPDLMLNFAITKTTAEASSKVEFRASVSADDITFLTMKLEELSEPPNKFQHYGPYFVNTAGLDIDFQRALRSYIEVRGFTVSNAEFIHQYIAWKAERDRMLEPEIEENKFYKE